jgi:hypothetical protein
MSRLAVLLLALTGLVSVAAAHSHTHIGRNPDGNWATVADNDQLWFFAMPGTPGWPDWGEPNAPVLELVQRTSGPLAGQWVCEDLYCWHSGHPGHGGWQLGGADPNAQPDWRIGIERVSHDPNFRTLDYNTLAEVLAADGDMLWFDADVEFMGDKYNEHGTLGSWGFHNHMWFVASKAEVGDVFEATYRAVDSGSTGFTESAPYTMRFQAVPEPVSAALLPLGWALAAGLGRRRRRREAR